MDTNFFLLGSTKLGETEYLRELASLSEDIIVEIGGFQGRTSIELAKGSKMGNNNHIYVIDVWDGSKVNNTKDVYFSIETFKKNINEANVSDIITPIHSTSSKALETWDKKIGMLFIDGDHSYNGVKKDIKWIDYVVSGGIVAFHDYFLPNYKDSVVKAVDEIRDQLIFDRHIYSLIVFRKK
jgi:predicted O-methyltransferase YrrM